MPSMVRTISGQMALMARIHRQLRALLNRSFLSLLQELYSVGFSLDQYRQQVTKWI